MKRILTILSLVGVVFAGQAQPFLSQSFLSARTLTVTNTGGYTNTLAYFGQGAGTNQTGLQYTNNNGTWVIPITGATSGALYPSNGVAVITNDQSALAIDVTLAADRNGNLLTNQNLSMAMNCNSTATGAVVCVFAPILKGPLNGASGVNPGPPPFSNTGTGTILDIAHTITVPFTITAGSYVSTSAQFNGQLLAGVKGLRLLSASVTNVNGQVTIFDLSRNTFVP